MDINIARYQIITLVIVQMQMFSYIFTPVKIKLGYIENIFENNLSETRYLHKCIIILLFYCDARYRPLVLEF